jgi:GntR family transcriptional regulator
MVWFNIIFWWREGVLLFNFALDRSGDIPLYIQIKDKIRNLITEGYLDKGNKLPTERELAQSINVSRNTISIAYKELVHEGVLISVQGKGTFVADTAKAHQHESLKERLIRIIDGAMEDASRMGFGLDEFLALTHVRAMEKKEQLSKLRVAFIECHREQLEYFETEIRLGQGVNIIPILLDDFLNGDKKYIKMVESFDVIITSITHIKEVKKYLPNHNRVLGVVLQPQIDTIVKIAKLPPNSKVCIVCHTETYSKKVKQALERVDVNYLEWSTFTDELTESEVDTLKECSLVITCASRKKEVVQLLKDSVKIIEFCFLPDAGSLNLIKSVLLDCKSRL